MHRSSSGQSCTVTNKLELTTMIVLLRGGLGYSDPPQPHGAYPGMCFVLGLPYGGGGYWGGRPVQRVEEWGIWASRTRKRSLRAEVHGQQKPSNDPCNNQHNPQYANYWAPLTHKRHPPHPAQPRHTNHWAPRTRKRHQQGHRPQRPTKCKRSDPTQHAKGRTGD